MIRITVDPTDLQPGDVVVGINDYDEHGCHCDVLVTIDRANTRPLPDVSMYRAMRAGHRLRTGHDLVAHLVSEDGAIWRVERACCDAEENLT